MKLNNDFLYFLESSRRAVIPERGSRSRQEPELQISRLRPPGALSGILIAVAIFTGVGAMSGTAAARDCSYCNTLSKVGACCRGTQGCTYYKNHDTDQYVCKSATAAPKSSGPKVSAKDCSRNYNQCIRTLRGSIGRTKEAASVTSDRKKNRRLAAAALRDGRASCKRRLDACRRAARGE